MIHWTRQIKELLNNQDTNETSENSGPLEEITFWRGRCNDLLGISDQLVKPGVKQIVSVLTLAKSSYVGPFLKLSKLIQVRRFIGFIDSSHQNLISLGSIIQFIWISIFHWLIS